MNISGAWKGTWYRETKGLREPAGKPGCAEVWSHRGVDEVIQRVQAGKKPLPDAAQFNLRLERRRMLQGPRTCMSPASEDTARRGPGLPNLAVHPSLHVYSMCILPLVDLFSLSPRALMCWEEVENEEEMKAHRNECLLK